MVLTRFLNICHLGLQKNKCQFIDEFFRGVKMVRHCSIISDYPEATLGDFSKDVKHFLKTRKKTRYKKESFLENPQNVFRTEEPVIKCKNPFKNHYRNQIYEKFKPIPLASENWIGHKSVGDHFTICVYTKDYKLPESPKVKFEDEDIRIEIADILKQHDVEEMSPVQIETLSKIKGGYNTLIAAETGCGKTLAYLVPVIEQILNWKANKESKLNAPFVIILTPSRELTEQIRNVINWFKPLDITSHKLFGGHFKLRILNPHVGEVDCLVSTAGAINKFVATGVYSLQNVRHIILDEADALLDDSFNDSTLTFLNKFKFRAGPLEDGRDFGAQLTLVSATMPTSLSDLLGQIIEIDFLEKITTNNLHKTMPHIPQKFIRINRSTKPAYLLRYAKADYINKRPLIIFCNSSSTCNWVSMFLTDNNIENIRLNGEMDWTIRKDQFKKFQNKDVNVLVCTSIASRGLDTQRAQHVINFEFPSFIADYIHRCGRTGRLGSKFQGKVTNLISSKNEISLVQKIEKAVRLKTEFENVNPNIKRIIRFKGASAENRVLGIDKFEEKEEDEEQQKEGAEAEAEEYKE